MSQESYEAFVQTFPSDELLCGLFGVASYNDLFEQHYKEAAQFIGRGEVLAVYSSDVSIARALESGELIFRKGRGKQKILELNKELYRKNCNLFKRARHQFHSNLIVTVVQQMRWQADMPGWNGTPRQVHIFKDGAYGEVVLAYEQRIVPDDDVLRSKLCRELIGALKKNLLHEDIWWEYKIEGDSVWLQPKELTDELMMAMQKLYDEARARHSLFTVGLSFYPGWEPDRSKDPPDDWKPAGRLEIR